MIKRKINNKLVLILASATIFISILFLIDLTPYLRGPGVYPPDWRWHYDPSINLVKIILPLSIIALIIFLSISEKIQKNEKLFLFFVLILGICFEFALLFYGRAGVGVLVHRIINPLINGYFTASLSIDSIPVFMNQFVNNFENYPMYARFHPPLAILIFHFLNIFSKITIPLFPFIDDLSPSFNDVQIVWSSLKDFQKLTVLYSSILIPLLTVLTIIPIYLTSKLEYTISAARKSAILFIFVPSILLFLPLNDAFLPLFTAISLYFFVKAVKTKNLYSFFLSGLILGTGIYFSLTFIPIILFFAIYYLLKLKKISINDFKAGFAFLIGLIILPIIFYIFFKLDSIQMFFKMMQFHEEAQHSRGYLVWLFYNLYDFFIFLGIPIFILILSQLYLSYKKIVKKDYMMIAFILFLLILNFTGSVRAETARIWLPFVPLAIIPVANFLTEIKFTNKQFAIILLVLGFQILVFQSVLVTLY